MYHSSAAGREEQALADVTSRSNQRVALRRSDNAHATQLQQLKQHRWNASVRQTDIVTCGRPPCNLLWRRRRRRRYATGRRCERPPRWPVDSLRSTALLDSSPRMCSGSAAASRRDDFSAIVHVRKGTVDWQVASHLSIQSTLLPSRIILSNLFITVMTSFDISTGWFKANH